MGNKIGVSVAQGLNVSNFFKNVPNFVKDVPNFVKNVSNFVKDVLNFVKDIPMLPKFVMRWGTTFNNFLRVSKGKNGLWK